METELIAENDYSELLKKELKKLVSKYKNNSKELTLELKLIKKAEEIKPELDKNEQNIYIYFIISNSLYFIKGNQFKTDRYFSLISNDIYKNFYQLIKNPCEEQFRLFQEKFGKLGHGANIIYLLCLKIYKLCRMGHFDLFFSIIIKNNIFRI